MILAYAADAKALFGRVNGQYPTDAELSALTDAWPTMGTPALEDLARQIAARRGPANPTGGVVPPVAQAGFPWLLLVIAAVVLFLVLRK